MDTKFGLREACLGRQVARERMKKERQAPTSNSVFASFQDLWTFLSYSPNYQAALSSNLAAIRRERVERNAELHTRLRAHLAAKEQNRAIP